LPTVQDVFKKFAKKVSDHVIMKWDCFKHELDGEIKTILRAYFGKHKRASGDEDLTYLDTLFQDNL